MRLAHLALMILVAAVILATARELAGRVMLVMFLTALAEVVVGTTAVMGLFRTVGAIGRAHGPADHVEAAAATALVLLTASATMAGLLWAGIAAVRALVA